MKTLTKLFSIAIFLFFIQVQGSFGQTATVLKGIITNKITGEKLAYASIYCKKDGIGTISNENGEFKFFIPENSTDEYCFYLLYGI
ncbi:MAG: carboxypeptidase-like regulatory domain-containing protein [Bacteroidales bacterium]|nr:carboxypeptidase-like regulatory domain-containing protein [Bacteroidales bacterium]